MKELETLLTSLVHEGWKPWGIEWDDIDLFLLDMKRKNIHIWYMDYSNPEEEVYDQEFKTFRELVSLESGLWQFVVENRLYKPINCKYEVYLDYKRDRYDTLNQSDTNYRLLESALVPEEELSKFLIDNIKVEWKKE